MAHGLSGPSLVRTDSMIKSWAISITNCVIIRPLARVVHIRIPENFRGGEPLGGSGGLGDRELEASMSKVGSKSRSAAHGTR